jgi:hypothetical protein
LAKLLGILKSNAAVRGVPGKCRTEGGGPPCRPIRRGRAMKMQIRLGAALSERMICRCRRGAPGTFSRTFPGVRRSPHEAIR